MIAPKGKKPLGSSYAHSMFRLSVIDSKDGWYEVQCIEPGMQGARSLGKSRKEAKENIRKVISVFLKDIGEASDFRIEFV